MKVGLIGTGNMGSTHANAMLTMPDIEVVVLSRIADRDAAFAQKYNATTESNLDHLLSSVDIVDICTPTDTHHEIALKAISHGRGVFLEKPLARTWEQGVEVVKAADAANVPLGVGQVVRFFHEFELGNRMVKNGSVGTPAAARLRRGGAAPGRWFMDHARSGGVLLDLAIHDFDWLRWTLGEVKSLYSRSTAIHVGHGPDYALTTLTFDSGAIAHVESTWMDPSGFRTAFEVAGSGGIIQYDSRDAATLRTSTTNGSSIEQNFSPQDDPYARELRAFFDAVRAGTKPPVGGEDALGALSIALAAVESAKTGQAVAPTRF